MMSKPTMPPFEMVGELKTWRLNRIKVLGKGSFGLATLVSCADSGDLYVAKEVNLQCIKKAEELEGLHQEIKILKTVKHPNVVRYVDSSSDEASFMMTILMEYCDGGDLHERIKECGEDGMPENEVASVLIQILMALRHLHLEHRILHRDLKPQNVFLTKDGQVKLGDFGVSTVLTQSIDFAKTFCGSPYYLAPELCEEQPYNGKADMWSVGVILYECMAKGARPFPAKNLVALVMQITKAKYDVEPLAVYNSELKDIVGTLLQRLPINRPTFARLTRLPYIREHLHAVPRSLLNSREYSAALGARPIAKALGMKGAEGPTGDANVGNEMSEELLKWAESDKKRHGEQKPIVDPDYLTDRNKREMKSSTESANRTVSQKLETSSHPPVLKNEVSKLPTIATMMQRQGSTAMDDDETWNSKYADDEFEDEDDDNEGFAESTERKELAMNSEWQLSSFVPMTEQSFHFV